MAVLERADELASSEGLETALADDQFLPSGLHARLRAFAAALQQSPQAAGAAMERIRDHRLVRLIRERCEVAEMTARVRRWLETPAGTDIPSVATGVRRYLGDWGWVDRALNVLWAGDPDRDPILGNAYRLLYGEARARRAELDRAFADRLKIWTPTASAQAPGGTLPVESVLAEVVLPLAAEAPPLVFVLDGMTGSVAAQIGEELGRGGRWLEVTATAGARRAAISMIPSVTTVSRASLLSGAPASGGQAVEAAGFAAFWRRHHRPAVLFHKAQIAGGAGHRLAQPLLDALAGDEVVGVVLNTIDDALDHDREGDRVAWKPSDITFLPDLLNAARDYARPVVLVSDHGHVLERGEHDNGRVNAPGVGSARWRTGAPQDGEVELTGPRVLEGGGRIVVPWREDIRYTPRKAGYHGGASLAEMTVPVLVFVPLLDLVPKGWTVLPPEKAAPQWWNPATAPETAAPAPERPREKPSDKPRRRGGKQPEPQAGEALFPVSEAALATGPAVAAEAPATLGERVTRSPLYAGQKKYLRKAPEARQVAAVVNALAEAGGKLSPAAVSAAATAAGGRAPRNAEMFITALQRLLNIEGYPVLELTDSGRTVELNTELLGEQFGVTSSEVTQR
jgi:hypothetical protein